MSDHDALRILYTGTRAPGVDPAGAQIRHLPMLEAIFIDFDTDAARQILSGPATVVFYSQNAVRAVADAGVLEHPSVDRRKLVFWAVGAKTKQAVEEAFERPAHAPSLETFEGLVEAMLVDVDLHNPIVAFGLEDSPRHLAEWLPDARSVTAFDVYRTAPRLYPNLGETLREFDPDWVAFTSPRGVTDFVTQARDHGWPLNKARLAAIGPTTAESIQEYDLPVSAMPADPGRRELIEAILAASRQ